jgi:hypothetical protein
LEGGGVGGKHRVALPREGEAARPVPGGLAKI